MGKFDGKKRPVINLSLFSTLPGSFSSMKSPPRSFEGGVVGLGIVAAMTDFNPTNEAFFSAKFTGAASNLSLSPRSSPIPIASLPRAAGGAGKTDSERDEVVSAAAAVVDELSESYTCVISHLGNSSVKKRVYFDDTMKKVLLDDCSAMFSASPLNLGGEVRREFGAADFLSCCYLCNKHLHGLDIFMYRGEKAFCSSDCRDKHIRVDKRKEKCRSEAMEFSVSPCSGPMLFSSGVAAA